MRMNENVWVKAAKRMGKTAMVLAAAVLLLTGCQSGRKLSDKFDEAQVKAQAETLLGYLNEEKFEEFAGVSMIQDVKGSLTAENMSAIMEQVAAERGAFVEYKGISVIGQQDAQGQDNAVVVAVAKYENQTITYTVSYNENMEMNGFHLK